MGMHIQGIDGQIVCRQVETLEYFFKRQISEPRLVREASRKMLNRKGPTHLPSRKMTVSCIGRSDEQGVLHVFEDFSFPGQTDLGRVLHLTLDEAQQVLLVHARRMVNMGVDLTDIVEVSGGVQVDQQVGLDQEFPEGIFLPMRNRLS
jgi:hypothetical protein